MITIGSVLSRRMNKIEPFYDHILDLCSSYDLRHHQDPNFESSLIWFDKYTYFNFLYSFRSLCLKEWYSQEEIQKILS